jgi:hypothetical protein
MLTEQSPQPASAWAPAGSDPVVVADPVVVVPVVVVPVVAAVHRSADSRHVRRD